ncbi:MULTISPECIES: winged helix-turn-helix transcriptional regulator [Streptomyces]|uniref:Transcriptional regulator n=1 Tax=Streptomyces tsukubensis (strain DSM 42081 / NBRC 108919 / NRRL 18488 / 9993) TaxID=1114943 RepID=I2N7U9_STRT9|nr:MULTISPECIES: winged helix-turn-helix transcriptional regulator [Streptomyces]AZK97064.1 hypothetical protein B7R87_26730 [Streptomyces tsukubensis]EIF93096.1 MarR family transcriptional regulator [Streptomyces tsukubensis NRRL18488]MYS66493.1 MarR family transcriptional regulator [Streptomyces sp. SID5473]QKM66965.1 transcriptional regulator [Streptomyces tsukubensis NRRL18488]TAI41558.1 transcriptional regulator [Streptomyces tsukubensis]
MLTPRWTVHLVLVVAEQPLRYTEIKQRMRMSDGQLHPKLRQLVDLGLADRTEHGVRHVAYGLTRRGTDLLPVLAAIATWADTHLEQAPDPAPETGVFRRARDIEDALVLIAARHATPILWTLAVRGTATAATVAADAMPGHRLSSVYPRLRQLVGDGLAEATDGTFRLSDSGRALAPVYSAMAAWAAGRPLAGAAAHPLRGMPTIQTRLPAPAITTAWRAADLFSHQPPARAFAGAPAGGHRR